MRVRKRILIEAVIEVDENFVVDELGIGRYYEDSISNAEMLLMKQGEHDSDDYFRVIDYVHIQQLESEDLSDG